MSIDEMTDYEFELAHHDREQTRILDLEDERVMCSCDGRRAPEGCRSHRCLADGEPEARR
jgi:hypothetical protein